MTDPLDDVVILGGHSLPINGVSRVSARSEFESGLKVGPTNYDNREDSFFIVFNDVTGGFGSKFLDIRKELGTTWFSDPANAPETAYADRVTLPLRQTFVSMVAPQFFDMNVNIGYPHLEWDNYYLFSCGGTIYSLSSLGATPQALYTNNTSSIVTIASAVDPVAGLPRLYASLSGGLFPPIFSLDDGQTWNPTSSHYITEQFPLVTGTRGDLLAEDKVYVWVDGQELHIGSVKGHASYKTETIGGDVSVSTLPFYNAAAKDIIDFLQYQAQQPNFKSPVGGAFITTADSVVPVEDIFFWDHKLLGQWGDTKISFLVPGSGDGLILYTLPKGDYVTAASYIKIGTFKTGEYPASTENIGGTPYPPGSPTEVIGGAPFATGYTVFQPDPDNESENALPEYTDFTLATYKDIFGYVATASVHYTEDQKVFITAGEEPWNHLVEGDKQIVAAIEIARELRFVGVATAPWGEPAVYCRAGNRLYVLDFFARKIYPIEIGTNKPIIQACMWQGNIVATTGWDVFEYSPQATTSRNIGFPRKWGIPPNLVGVDGAYEIIALCPLDDELLALAADITGENTILFKHNGSGWHQVGRKMTGFLAQQMFRATFPLPNQGQFDNRAQAIIVPGRNSDGSFGYWMFDLPTVTHQPTNGLDTFGESNAVLYTGWVDGGFFDIYGTLLRMDCDAFLSGDERIKVEYRLDNDTASELEATWLSMVDIDANIGQFSPAITSLYFASPAPKAGIKFRTVQFKISLIRGAEATHTPELRALTLQYIKTAELRTLWTFRVDVNRMTESSANPNEYWLEAAPATQKSMFKLLSELWTNNHVLIPMTVPTMSDKTFYVKMLEMPLSFDDFRLEALAKGYVDVTVVEPVI